MGSMRVSCPDCGAEYQFHPSAIPPEGYDAQCTNCSKVFFVAPEEQGATDPDRIVNIACPGCKAQYQFPAKDIPAGGYDAQCTQCNDVFFVSDEVDGSSAAPVPEPESPKPEPSPAEPTSISEPTAEETPVTVDQASTSGDAPWDPSLSTPLNIPVPIPTPVAPTPTPNPMARSQERADEATQVDSEFTAPVRFESDKEQGVGDSAPGPEVMGLEPLPESFAGASDSDAAETVISTTPHGLIADDATFGGLEEFEGEDTSSDADDDVPDETELTVVSGAPSPLSSAAETEMGPPPVEGQASAPQTFPDVFAPEEPSAIGASAFDEPGQTSAGGETVWGAEAVSVSLETGDQSALASAEYDGTESTIPEARAEDVAPLSDAMLDEPTVNFVPPFFEGSATGAGPKVSDGVPEPALPSSVAVGEAVPRSTNPLPSMPEPVPLGDSQGWDDESDSDASELAALATELGEPAPQRRSTLEEDFLRIERRRKRIRYGVGIVAFIVTLAVGGAWMIFDQGNDGPSPEFRAQVESGLASMARDDADAYDEAISAFAQALELDPENERAQALRVVALMFSGANRVEDAKLRIARLEQQKGALADSTAVEAANILLEEGARSINAAFALLKEDFEGEPSPELLRAAAAYYSLNENGLKKARSLLARGRGIDEEGTLHSVPWEEDALDAVVAARTYPDHEAVALLTKAFKAHPDHLRLALDLARRLIDLDKLDAAEKYAENILATFPQHSRARRLNAHIDALRQQAETRVAEAPEVEPDSKKSVAKKKRRKRSGRKTTRKRRRRKR